MHESSKNFNSGKKFQINYWCLKVAETHNNAQEEK